MYCIKIKNFSYLRNLSAGLFIVFVYRGSWKLIHKK